jgi:hypothetical protein
MPLCPTQGSFAGPRDAARAASRRTTAARLMHLARASEAPYAHAHHLPTQDIVWWRNLAPNGGPGSSARHDPAGHAQQAAAMRQVVIHAACIRPLSSPRSHSIVS